MKQLLDLAPALIFFTAWALTDIYKATIALIASMFALVVIYRVWKREWHKVHIVTFLVAAVLGGLTLYFHDAAFIKLKPSLVYGLFAVVLLGSHFIGDKVLLARLPQSAIQLPDPVWRKVNLAWAGFFAFCAALNLYVAMNFDEATWVKLKAFGFTAMTFVFLIAHFPFLSRYLPQDEKPSH